MYGETVFLRDLGRGLHVARDGLFLVGDLAYNYPVLFSDDSQTVVCIVSLVVILP